MMMVLPTWTRGPNKRVGAARRCYFFFSSRRRHTRLQGDWSSDVCSSDLAGRSTDHRLRNARRVERKLRLALEAQPRDVDEQPVTAFRGRERVGAGSKKIGRASCRERV